MSTCWDLESSFEALGRDLIELKLWKRGWMKRRRQIRHYEISVPL